MRKVSYDVADLIRPVPLFYVGTPSSAQISRNRENEAPDFDSLSELITSMVKPASWDCVGGPGSVSPSPANLNLVINQTDEIHKDIADLLEEVRWLHDLSIALRVSLLSVPDEGMPAGLKERQLNSGAMVSIQDVEQLIDEAKRQGTDGFIPLRVTVQNGQMAIITCASGKDNTQVAVIELFSVASADLKSIRLSLGTITEASNPDPAAPRVLNRMSAPLSNISDQKRFTPSVPDGGTFLAEWVANPSHRQEESSRDSSDKTPRVRRFILITPRLVKGEESSRDHRFVMPPPAVPSWQ